MAPARPVQGAPAACSAESPRDPPGIINFNHQYHKTLPRLYNNDIRPIKDTSMHL